VTSRREFAGGLVGAALGVTGLHRLPRGAGRPAVEAVPTIFHGYPDGQTTLVRFLASGIDALAGRLRVVDQAGRLIATAGMLRRADLLVGELWLPLAKPLTIRSRLETPVTRGVIQTTHRLVPTPRLTLSWLTIVEPDALEAHALDVPLLARGVDAAALLAAGVRANPWSPPAGGRRDHLDLLRAAVPAAAAQSATGVAVSRIAVVDAAQVEPFIGPALAGSGVEVLLTTAQVVAPDVLGFGEGRLVMARRVEQWLLSDAPEDRPSALVVGTDLASTLRAIAAVEDWNGAYAYPHILVGDGDAALVVARRHAVATPRVAVSSPPSPAAYRRPAEMFRAFAQAVSPDDPTLAGLAGAVAFPVSGTLVLNPSPFGQSDAVALPDGTMRVVTDVPGIGYAFVPGGAAGAAGAADAAGAAGAAGAAEWNGSEIETERFRLRLDRGDGAIVSLVNRATGRELVRPGGRLNGLDAAVLSGVTIGQLREVGVRIRARRVTPQGGAVSTITLYDALPWVDITNETEERQQRQERQEGQERQERQERQEWREGVAWGFDFAPEVEEVRWDVAGGSLAAAPPVMDMTPLRWVALRGDGNAVLLAVRNATGAAFDGTRLTLQDGGAARPGTDRRRLLRIRLADHPGYLLPDDPWRLGYSLESLIAVPAPGTGTHRLPTFGRLFDVPDPAVAVVGVKPADDGVGVVVYLMDLAGLARTVPVRPGVLAFDGAILTDLTERDRQPADHEAGGGVLVPLAERRYAAVRLLGIRLA
jgi:hypothetical protein